MTFIGPLAVRDLCLSKPFDGSREGQATSTVDQPGRRAMREETIVATLRLLPPPGTTSFHDGEISACCYAPDGRCVLSGGWDGHIRLWDGDSGRGIVGLRVGTKPVSACAIAPEGDRWLAGSLDGILSCWDPATQRQISMFLAHTRPVSGIAFGPDNRILATAAWDCNLAVWSRTNERECRTLTGHTDIVSGCRFTPNGRTIVSWSHDRTVRLWEVARCRLVQTLKGHSDRVVSAAVSPDGSWAVSGARDGGLILWDLEAECEAGLLTLDQEIKSCLFLPHGEAFVTVEANGRARVHSVPDMEVEAELETGLTVQCADLAPSGGQIALGGVDGHLRFIVVDGFDSAPLVVTATQTSRRTATTFERFLGKSHLTHAYQCICPACGEAFELAATDPDQPAPCPHCQRPLRIRAVIPMAR